MNTSHENTSITMKQKTLNGLFGMKKNEVPAIFLGKKMKSSSVLSVIK